MQRKKIYMVSCLSAALLAGVAYAAPGTVVTGGVGIDSREMIAREEQSKNYNLKLVYTGDRGMYLSDVNVTIRDNRTGETIVQGATQGPILLAELAPGAYTVESSIDGHRKIQTATVDRNMKTFHVSFPVGEVYYDLRPEGRMMEGSISERTDRQPHTATSLRNE